MMQYKKSSVTLIDPYYDTAQTSLLTFSFEPTENELIASRLMHSHVQRDSIDGKDIYIMDGFFDDHASKELREFSSQATFSRNSYGSAAAITKGEKPALSMNGQERWKFFAKPPLAIQQIYQLLQHMAYHLQAQVSTLPWELCDKKGNGSPSVIANFLEEASSDSMEHGKHRDSDPVKGLPFLIPKLYVPGEGYPRKFMNGAPGMPWIVSVMVYVTAENFQPEYKMGTVFYDAEQQIKLATQCLHMRIVLFESDICHSIERSCIPPGCNTWRVSYVFKLMINPQKGEDLLKEKMYSLLKPVQCV